MTGARSSFAQPGGAVGWIALSFIEQFLFGASSIVLVLTATRWGGPGDGGAAALLLVPYILLCTLAQGAVVDSNLLSAGGSSRARLMNGARSAATWSVIALPATTAWNYGWSSQLHVSLAAAVASVLAVPHFIYRSTLLAAKRTKRTLVASAAWLVPQVAACFALGFDMKLFGLEALAVAGIGWSLGAVLASLVLCDPTSLLPKRLTPAFATFVNGRHLSWEPVLGQAGAQMNIFVLAVAGGTALTGVFRSAQILTTPGLLVVASLRHPLLPMLIDRVADPLGFRRLIARCAVGALAMGIALAAVAWTTLNLIGTLLLGPSASTIRPVAVVLALDVGLAAITVLCSLALRAKGQASLGTRLRAANAVTQLAALATAALLTRDAFVAATFLVGIDALACLVWLSSALRALPAARSRGESVV